MNLPTPTVLHISDNTPSVNLYYTPTTDSTMLLARRLEKAIVLPAAVLTDFQTQGKGRISGRRWHSGPKESLLCTLVFKGPPVAGFTLKIGLATALAIETITTGRTKVQIKWPNDLLINGRKTGGILCESDGKTVLAGIGINLAQTRFPPEISDRATSILIECGLNPEPQILLIQILQELFRLTDENSQINWQGEVEARLWNKGERTVFNSGYPATNESVCGIIQGINYDGSLRIKLNNGTDRVMYSGEFS